MQTAYKRCKKEKTKKNKKKNQKCEMNSDDTTPFYCENNKDLTGLLCMDANPLNDMTLVLKSMKPIQNITFIQIDVILNCSNQLIFMGIFGKTPNLSFLLAFFWVCLQSIAEIVPMGSQTNISKKKNKEPTNVTWCRP